MQGFCEAVGEGRLVEREEEGATEGLEEYDNCHRDGTEFGIEVVLDSEDGLVEEY
jgi:hypothetical protein